jgi:hypothetical protein
MWFDDWFRLCRALWLVFVFVFHEKFWNRARFILERDHQLRNAPTMICEASFHRRRDAQGLMDAAEIVTAALRFAIPPTHISDTTLTLNSLDLSFSP